MAAGINDKFKKVSADSSYAVATTVRTARTVGGGTTLEAFDLSKWADATAVNFLTYRKTTDPVTNITTVTNRTGWTALVNTGSNTLTNLTIAPGYTDLGQQVGDYIEPVQMSKWANDLVDGILVTHNQDGTLKDGIVTANTLADSVLKTGAATFFSSGATSMSSQYGYYQIINKVCYVFFRGTLAGSVGTNYNTIQVAGVPIDNNYHSTASPSTLGEVAYFDTSASKYYRGYIRPSSYAGGVVNFRLSSSLDPLADVAINNPFTWAAGDTIQASFSFKVA